jgi:hypothetical protein
MPECRHCGKPIDLKEPGSWRCSGAGPVRSYSFHFCSEVCRSYQREHILAELRGQVGKEPPPKPYCWDIKELPR